MNNVYFLVLLIFILGCSEEDNSPRIDPPNEIGFQIEQRNSNNDFISNAENIEIQYKSSRWGLNVDGEIRLTREVMFNVGLENGETIEFGFWFMKNETSENDLTLRGEDLDNEDRSWDYVSTDAELKRFYQDFDEARLLVNYNVMFHNESNENFEVISIEQATVNGEHKSFVTIEFSGIAFGWYDPTGEFQEVYEITDGVFKGIIE
ncbi:MAG: hypothetical protein JXR07_16550 [Reichenbachiella sp.]